MTRNIVHGRFGFYGWQGSGSTVGPFKTEDEVVAALDDELEQSLRDDPPGATAAVGTPVKKSGPPPQMERALKMYGVQDEDALLEAIAQSEARETDIPLEEARDIAPVLLDRLLESLYQRYS